MALEISRIVYAKVPKLTYPATEIFCQSPTYFILLSVLKTRVQGARSLNTTASTLKSNSINPEPETAEPNSLNSSKPYTLLDPPTTL